LQEIRERDDWFEKFQKSLTDQEKNIDRILKGLEEEVKDRRGSDKDLEGKIHDFNADIKEYSKSAYKTAAWIGTLGALIMSVLIWLVQTLVLSRSTANDKAKQPDIHITIDSSVLKNSQQPGR
jgi:hypothetical protein